VNVGTPFTITDLGVHDQTIQVFTIAGMRI
jgi:hypothetical protein